MLIHTPTLASQFCPMLPYLHVVRLQFIHFTHHWTALRSMRILIKFNEEYVTFEVLRWLLMIEILWYDSLQTDVQVPIIWTSCLAAMHKAVTVMCVLSHVCEVCWGFSADTGYFAMSHGNLKKLIFYILISQHTAVCLECENLMTTNCPIWFKTNMLEMFSHECWPYAPRPCFMPILLQCPLQIYTTF